MEEDAFGKQGLWQTQTASLDYRIHLVCSSEVSHQFLPKETMSESLAIGRWILDTYGHRHPVTAIFMDHAIANNNHSILKVYVGEDVPRHSRVPITLKHFQIMARLGIDPVSISYQYSGMLLTFFF